MYKMILPLGYRIIVQFIIPPLLQTLTRDQNARTT